MVRCSPASVRSPRRTRPLRSNLRSRWSPAITIATGGSHNCALTDGGRAKCWGFNHFCPAWRRENRAAAYTGVGQGFPVVLDGRPPRRTRRLENGADGENNFVWPPGAGKEKARSEGNCGTSLKLPRLSEWRVSNAKNCLDLYLNHGGEAAGTFAYS